MVCKYTRNPDIYDAYLLGELSPQEAEAFEKHYFDCEDCARELSFREGIIDDVKKYGEELFPEFVGETATEKGQSDKKKRLIGSILKALVRLPEGVVAEIGQYIEKGLGIRPVQAIHLIPERAISENVLKISQGYDGLIRFVFRDAVPGMFYQVSIENERGEIIFCDKCFQGFDEHETGQLFIPLRKMEPGNYRLLIKDPKKRHLLNKQEYVFLIEE